MFRTIRFVSSIALLLGMVSLVTLESQQPPSSPPAAQTPQPAVTFKIEVNYVEVDTIVTDAAGNFVRTLAQNDFQIYEDGKPQEIKAFALVDIPVERRDTPLFRRQPVEPDVVTNGTGLDGRVYVILLDDLHTGALRSNQVKRAAKQFIETRLGANDLAAVVHIGGRMEAGQEFTNNRRLLLAAVDKFVGRKLRSSTLERIDEYNRQRNLPSQEPLKRINDPLDAERGFQARNTLRTLKSVADTLAGVRGRRKSVLLFSEGIDYDIYDVFNNQSATDILHEARETIAAATRANVSFYGVDPRGLTSLGDEGIEITNFPEDPGLGLGPTTLHTELQRSQDSLRVVSDETGGFTILNTNDFKGGFDRIVRENSSYYVLGYYPTNTRRDGRFRKIEVRVKNSALQVRSRKGYAAPTGRRASSTAVEAKEGTSAALREVLNSPIPQGGLTLTALAIAFKGPAPKAVVSVAVHIEGKEFSFNQRDGKFSNVLEVSMMALDNEAKVRGGERHQVTMDLRPETRARVVQSGFRMLAHLEIPPGRHQLRIAARESNGGRIGSVHYDLEVPDFAKTPFAMSGLAISSASAKAVITTDPKPSENPIPVVLTTDRSFTRGDVLDLFVEVYDNTAARVPGVIDIMTQLQADDGRTVFQSREERSSKEIPGGKGGYVHNTTIPLKDAAPGLYVLRVEARQRAQGQTVAREVQITVK